VMTDPDPQNSLLLSASQAQGGLTLDGQQTPAANQVASATSGNNCSHSFDLSIVIFLRLLIPRFYQSSIFVSLDLIS
jgi:hypothetical protein